MKLILAVIVALAVGAGGGYWFEMMKVDEVNQQLTVMTQQKNQAQQNADRLMKADQDAVKKWGNELGKLIVAATAAPEAPPAATDAPAAPVVPDTAKIVDGARAILAARDGFRASLDNARAAMDSDLDALASELGNPKMDPMKVQNLLQTLRQGWPDKQKALESATHALLADLGILPPEKPAAAMTPAAAPAAMTTTPAPAAPAAPAKK